MANHDHNTVGTFKIKGTELVKKTLETALISGYRSFVGTFKIKGTELVKKTLETALISGYRSFDTASVYHNEKDIGAALKVLFPEHGTERKDIFITSKLGPKDHGLGNCAKSCLQSIEQLGCDYLDLYLIHWPGTQGMQPQDSRHKDLRRESWMEMEKLVHDGLDGKHTFSTMESNMHNEVMKFLKIAYVNTLPNRAGKIKSIGISNYLQHHIEELLSYSTIIPSVLQIEHHPHLQQRELIAFCKKQNIHFQAYSSLGTTTDNNMLLSNKVVKDIANNNQKSPAQILLRWAVQQDIGVLPKSTDPQHIKDNINIFDFELTESDMTKLNSLDKQHHYCWNPEKVL